jgi:hypothetical protein
MASAETADGGRTGVGVPGSKADRPASEGPAAPRRPIDRLADRLRIYRAPTVLGLSCFGVVFLGWLLLVVGPAKGTTGFDAFAYWAVSPWHPYATPLGQVGSFTYTPAVALFFAPFHNLMFGAFYLLWAGFLAANLIWLTRRHAFLWLAFIPVSLELYEANVHLLLATVCVLGFSYPGLWSIGILTKVTPGITLLWFVVRREWRSLAIALGTTAVIALVSFVIAPGAWFDWVSFLTASSSTGPVDNASYQWLIPPLAARLAAAAVLIVWGARTDRRWVVPVATVLAMPVLWITSPAVLVAIPRLRSRVSTPNAPAGPESAVPA